jgi:ribosomal-protein-alanine acetyltransferase
VRIRAATAADIAPMKILEGGASTAAHWSSEQYEQIFTPGAPKRAVLVAEINNGEIAGFVIARAVSAEWEIENVAVSRQAQRRGVGTQLIRHLLHLARDSAAEAVFLEVRESNVAARALYRKLGFSESGQRKHYYQNPEEDAILYRLDFT